MGRLEGILEIAPTENYVEETNAEKKCRFCGQRIGADSNAHATLRAKEEERLAEARKEKETLALELTKLNSKEIEFQAELVEFAQKHEAENVEIREAERATFALRERLAKLEGASQRVDLEERALTERENDLKREKGEAAVLVGRDVADHLETRSPSEVDPDMRKKIERLKIRIEDFGGTGREVIKEHEEVETRDLYLAKEIEDLNKSAESLRSLMSDLTKTLEERFKGGLNKINTEFAKFFSLLFGGGEAELNLTKIEKRRREVDDDFDLATRLLSGNTVVLEEPEESGVEISVNLPRKKIKSLEQLSGGERALTSIALVFAMSQVNPPPFMVLDETDAALDEANSRKYGDMIEALSKKSQLILVTHNRETMSRANVLYGITMGSDSASKLLSIKFDDATVYAK